MRQSLPILVKIIKESPDAIIPQKQTPGASGMDLHALLDCPRVIPPHGRSLIPTGIRIILPPSFEGQIRSRSGLAHKHGVAVLNSPGTIDSDYRGELMVLLINLGDDFFKVESGDRIAQFVIAPVLVKFKFEVVESIDDSTERGEGGFGSTGV